MGLAPYVPYRSRCCPLPCSSYQLCSFRSSSGNQTTPVSVCNPGPGQRSRDIVCRTAAGDALPPIVCSANAPTPTNTTTCVIQPAAGSQCACTKDADCSVLDHRRCDLPTSTCVCGGGWGGDHCMTPVLQLRVQGTCEGGVVDLAGTCCAGYIDSALGLCCSPSWAVDAAGRCCPAEAVDACGVCNGTGVAVDVRGSCCDTALPPSRVCCEGQVDSCGVCGGSNTCM